MLETVVVCPECRRVIAVGAALPAVCFAAVPEAERRSLGAEALAAHPQAHTNCVPLALAVPDNLEGAALFEAIEKGYQATLATLAIARPGGSGRGP